MTDEPWRRAGGYPRDDWEKVLRLARERVVNAYKRVDAQREGGLDRVNAELELERAKAGVQNVLQGDSHTVSDLFGNVLLEEGRQMAIAVYYADKPEPLHSFGLWLFSLPADDPRLRTVAGKFANSYAGFRPSTRFEASTAGLTADLPHDQRLELMAELAKTQGSSELGTWGDPAGC